MHPTSVGVEGEGRIRHALHPDAYLNRLAVEGQHLSGAGAAATSRRRHT